MTDGARPGGEPNAALEELSDALVDLMAAVRRVAIAGSAVWADPEARDQVTVAIATVVDAVAEAVLPDS